MHWWGGGGGGGVGTTSALKYEIIVGRRSGGVAACRIGWRVEVDVARWSHCIVYKYLDAAFYPLTSSAGRLHVMSITYHRETKLVDRTAIGQCQLPVQWQMQQS